MNKYIEIHRIEFTITYLCNSRCQHCYVDDRKKFLAKHIDTSTALDIVRKLGKKYHPKSIMTFGGEPLLFPEIVAGIHKEAMRAGIPGRELITNGFWSKNPEKTEKIARKLADSGVNRICFSVDAFHQEHIILDIVKKAATACLEVGISDINWNPCWLISHEHDNRYNRKTKLILKELKNISPNITGGNIVGPEGLALKNLREFLPLKKLLPDGKCADMPYADPLDSVKSICVEPDGNIAVCNDFHIGNASISDIDSIIENYDPYAIPEMKVIIEEGMKGLKNLAMQMNIELDPEGYYSVCQMCINIRNKIKRIDKDEN